MFELAIMTLLATCGGLILLVIYLSYLISKLAQQLQGAILKGDFINVDGELTQYTGKHFIMNGGEKIKVNKVSL